MTQIVDDQLLGELLRGGHPPRTDEPAYTTGYWYVRLCQAVLGASERTGALSQPFAGQPANLRDQAIRRLLELPNEIGLVSLRTLGPLIARHRRRHRLNALGREALAAAVHLGADVFLSVPSPRLEGALRAEGLHVEVLG
ncbi:MAG: hypothetical protein OXC00_01960 [Acidimicrobiaceae bacterium]|nr:hypothetical protein [Acidimicrobiaceae bacterium]